ncbi:hypothetical protein B0H14DRAFT_2658605 [Mycena olivaceomarginata]|nr:hypothetical protein B0H14DRAFT_2658605 [Mycena olivaceomarginata]
MVRDNLERDVTVVIHVYVRVRVITVITIVVYSLCDALDLGNYRSLHGMMRIAQISPKILLFPEREKVPNTPPSLIIPDNDAGLGLLLKQCAGLIQEEALYERVRDAITSLGDIDWAVSPERQRAALKKIEDNKRRRELIDVRCHAEWQEHIRLHPLPPAPPRIRLIANNGRRVVREVPLTEDDLYMDDVRPPLIRFPLPEHILSLCHNRKSHPVIHCYVCIRLSLETTWNCPTCNMRMTTRPTAQITEGDSIAVQFPDWDESRIALHWDGLVFPRPKISLED